MKSQIIAIILFIFGVILFILCLRWIPSILLPTYLSSAVTTIQFMLPWFITGISLLAFSSILIAQKDAYLKPRGIFVMVIGVVISFISVYSLIVVLIWQLSVASLVLILLLLLPLIAYGIFFIFHGKFIVSSENFLLESKENAVYSQGITSIIIGTVIAFSSIILSLLTIRGSISGSIYFSIITQVPLGIIVLIFGVFLIYKKEEYP